ncbi:hypothetical protein [Stygiolobus caldivivus]|uniref:hypothetical protein n=1 Tax=Stygiolobus caldivivus TaxID=2824673 RepID=UPI001C864E83|nr:hypothetical protein [Stygiolobus caldivivus]
MLQGRDEQVIRDVLEGLRRDGVDLYFETEKVGRKTTFFLSVDMGRVKVYSPQEFTITSENGYAHFLYGSAVAKTRPSIIINFIDIDYNGVEQQVAGYANVNVIYPPHTEIEIIVGHGNIRRLRRVF